MNYRIAEEIPEIKEFVNLYKTTGWCLFSNEVFLTALQNSYYVICIYDNIKLIGMGRVISDLAMYGWIHEMIVEPEYQRKGIGTLIIEKILEKLKKDKIPYAGLFCNREKKEFYLKNGFKERPDYAPGMYYDIYAKYPSL